MSRARHHVYLIEGAGRTKIGLAENVQSRLAILRSNSPVELKLIAHGPGDRTLERSLHRRFREHRSHGEWFDVTFTPEEGRELLRKARNEQNAHRRHIHGPDYLRTARGKAPMVGRAAYPH